MYVTQVNFLRQPVRPQSTESNELQANIKSNKYVVLLKGRIIIETPKVCTTYIIIIIIINILMCQLRFLIIIMIIINAYLVELRCLQDWMVRRVFGFINIRTWPVISSCRQLSVDISFFLYSSSWYVLYNSIIRLATYSGFLQALNTSISTNRSMIVLKK